MKILIVDDHPLVRGSLRDLLFDVFDDPKITECSSADSALDCVRACHYDFAIMDIGIPGGDVFQIMQTMLSIHPHLKIAVFTASINQRVLIDATSVGVNVLIGKDAHFSEIAELLRVVACGGRALSSSFTFLEAMSGTVASNGWQHLTERERQVARLSADGCSIAQVSQKFGIAPATVIRHRHSILKKLGLQSTRQLMTQYSSAGVF